MSRIAVGLVTIGLAAIGAIIIGAPAFAADMPVKYKAPPPPPSWTGFYIGGNAGYGWGDPGADFAGSGTTVAGPFNCPVCFVNPPATFAQSHNGRLTGFVGGGQLGFNYQAAPNVVLGFEADIQGTAQRGSNAVVDPIAGTFCNIILGPCSVLLPLTGTATTSYQAKIEWFGTVRGRLGVLINDGLLLYGTGGLAYGRVGIAGNATISAGLFPPLATFGPTTIGFGQSRTNIGYTVGAGLEGKLPGWLPHWTWKLEYLYVDLGSLDTSTPFVAASSFPALAGDLTGAMTAHAHFRDSIVRVGLNYQFH